MTQKKIESNAEDRDLSEKNLNKVQCQLLMLLIKNATSTLTCEILIQNDKIQSSIGGTCRLYSIYSRKDMNNNNNKTNRYITFSHG